MYFNSIQIGCPQKGQTMQFFYDRKLCFFCHKKTENYAFRLLKVNRHKTEMNRKARTWSRPSISPLLSLGIGGAPPFGM